MLFLGCDPDLHCMALAWVTESLTLHKVECYRINDKIKGTEAIVAMGGRLGCRVPTLAQHIAAFAVEGQDLTRRDSKGRKPNPYTILHLASAAGLGIARCWQYAKCGNGYMPLASEWKGQVPKLVHHKRIATKAGIDQQYWKEMGGQEPYLSITHPDYTDPDTNPSDWKHIMDAIGLAQYAAERYTKEQRYAQIALQKVTNHD